MTPRWIMLGATMLLAQAAVNNCTFLGGSSTAPTDYTLNLVTTAPESVNFNDDASLSAAPSDDSNVSDLSYQWYQTYGRVVGLWDSDTDTARFIAPSVKTDQTLRFRVDATSHSIGVFASAEVVVTLAADPNAAGTTTGSEDQSPQVKLTTSKGVIVVELNRPKAPFSVNNFLQYVDDGFYDNTVFHRVIKDFVVQGGGYDTSYTQKETRDPIPSEASNGLKNARGTLAMARTNDPNSATSQFYINLIDNTSLDQTDTKAGYTVFGKVIQGMDVVDAIGAVATGTNHGMSDVPNEDVILTKAERVETSSNPSGLNDPNSVATKN